MSYQVCIPAIVLVDSAATSLDEVPDFVQAPRVTKKRPTFQAPRPAVAKKPKTSDVPNREVLFGKILQSTIAKQNETAYNEYFTVREEGSHEWSIMGKGCEYALVRLLESHKAFHIIALLPMHAEVAYVIPRGFKEEHIHDAMKVVFSGQSNVPWRSSEVGSTISIFVTP